MLSANDVGDLVVQTGLYVIQHAQLREQADVLERAGNAQLADFMRLFADEVLSVQTDAAVGRAVHAGQHIERGGLACAVPGR